MNIRQALLIVSAQFRIAPELYNFPVYGIPKMGEPGDVVGWVAAMRGVKAGVDFNVIDHQDRNYDQDFVIKVLGVHEREFYSRMDRIEANLFDITQDEDALSWRRNASRCAHILRVYADKYHPPRVADKLRKMLDAAGVSDA